MKITTKILVACLPGIVTGALFAASTGERTVSKPNDAAMSKVKASLGKLPLSFEPNRGQTDPRVQFLSRGQGYTVFFTKDETVMTLKDTNTSNAVVRMRFVGGNNSASVQPSDALPGYSNYLVGSDSSKWQTGVAEYTKLRYQDVYPGIDVVYQGEQRQLRYDFIVKPGASASAIQMAFTGADKISITPDGDLALTIGGKTLVTKKPFTYQEDGGAKKEVASHYILKDGRVTFELAKYDTTKDVVIDPTVVFVTYLGGSLNDSVNGVAIYNPTQTIASLPSFYYVTGTTTSPNFPVVNAPIGPAQTGVNDVFVTKISFNGATVIWSTYLGGNSQDTGNAIAVDGITTACATAITAATGAGCPIVVGQTYSANFPTAPFQGTPQNCTAGSVCPSNLSGTDDAFAAKLANDGKSLIYSIFIGGVTNDNATGVAVDFQGNAFVGGYTDSPYFLCPGGVIPPVGLNQCTNANHINPGTSSDAFVVKIPFNYPTNGFTALQSALYGGFGEDEAHGIAYNSTSNMVYLGGDTTTAAQNFVAPNAQNLPGITNNTVNQYTVTGASGVNVTSGLPGPSPQARGSFVVAFDATTFVRTFATYVAVSPSTGTCGGATGAACSQGTEVITGIAAEGGAKALGCSAVTLTCTPTSTPTSTIAATYGNIGHVYITGDTTSKVPTSLIASVVPGWSCANPLAAASTQAGPIIVGPTGLPVAVPGGTTIPAGCTTALITQSPFNNNVADVSLCPYPIRFDQPNILGKNCNFSAFVGILDGALLTAPVTGPPSAPAPVGNQIEYWAYYSAPNASTVSNALAIDTNPTTLTSVYSLGTYQQMYITGSTTLTGAGGGGINQLPVTYNANATVNEIFTSYNVGTTGGGGVGGWQPNDPASTTFNTDGYVARFNANGLAASSFGGQGATLAAPAVSFPNMGYGFGETLPPTQPNDHSFLIHTPQFNFGEFIFSLGLSADGSSNANTAGNAIAVDPTRAALIGGVTNVKQTACTATTTGTLPCQFTTTNFLGSTPSGAQNNGGNDGWVSVLFFNDILTDAASQSTANPFLQPGFPQLAPQSGTTAGCQPGGILDGKCSYIQTTPAPFGPTFDFAISDPSTQTQSFRVLLTGQTAGQLLTQTPWYVPLDPRSGVSNATLDNNLPGSGIAYYLPCIGVPPGNLPHGTLVDSLSPLSVAPDSPGYYNNAYPAPGSPYGPQSCNFPEPSALYEALPMLFSGWPGLTAAQANKTLVTPGWLLVTQDINPGVVRLQLDRRAAAGLLEGTYVAQFLVNTYDSQTQSQWPPCGPKSSLNPFGPTGTCTNPLTPLPADNVSILVTVRLIVRPSLFLSRNSGILTGVTSSLAANPLFGPQATITLQDGTSKVPDWYFTGATNDTAAWPAGAPAGLGTIFGAGFPANANAGPPTCVPGGVVGTTVANVIPIVPQLGNPANPVVIPNPPGVTIPCPISATAPATTATAIYGAAAYGGNGPGDLSDGPIGTAPRMTFLYDLGTVLTPTPAPLTVCNIFANDSTNNQIANECNLAIEQNLAPSRPDQPVGVLTFNASWEGGQDPLTQRNDATIHDYYIEAEGGATLSVAAINCTYWNSGPQGHVNAVGNWLGVQIGGVNVNAAGAPSPSAYTPICTDLSPTTVGTLPAPATIPLTPLNADDGANPGAIGGRQIVLDFFAKAFSGGCLSQAASAANGTTTCTLPANSVGPRSAMNGIPTGLYTATVYVWSTRAKNSVPGYCLGSDFAVDGGSPTICAPSSASVASSTNPNPEVVVTGQQFFNVSLSVFDTTQTIQITPNSCPTGGVTNGVTEFATIGGISENLFTGNITPPYGPGSFPNYANFGANASQLVEWSLLPFQTTGTNITGCTGPGGTTPQGLPCPNPLAPNAAGGDASGGNTAMNIPVPLPQGVVVAPQTLAQYNACQLPTGTFLGVAINGMQVPGVGQLVQTGPLSQTTFIPSANNTNNLVTIYACRPTIAPAWLNSVNYPGNNVFIPGSNPAVPVPGAPEQYSNGNGPYGGPNVGGAVAGCSAVGDTLAATYVNCGKFGEGPVPSTSALTCPLAQVSVGTAPGGTSKIGVFRPGASGTGSSFLEDTTGANAYIPGSSRFIANFLTGNFNGVTPLATDIAVAGDWTGDGHGKIGIYRPTTGQWFLDINNNGIYDAGDATYNYGGIAGDLPVTGDWTGIGKTCIGIFRQGFFWIIDQNCNGTFDAADATFPFGGITNDVPVTGAWTGTTTKVGVVRAYAPGGVVGPCTAASTVGCPFYWVLDSAATNAGSSAAVHQPAAGSFPYGGLFGDKFVTGDWLGTGTWRAGIFRSGNWIEDTTGAHTYDTFYQFGGVPNDQPIVAKW